ncbi:MAG: histidine phosphatase family protein [Gemmobacter sp.]
MALTLLRHTRPLGAEGLCYGHTDLAPGPDLAGEAARLAAELPPFAVVVTSPLTRCRALAEALAAARGVPLAVDPRIAEMDFGTWEGRPWAAIPRAEIDAWAADLMHACPHGGETVAALAARVGAALGDWRASPAPRLAVTHAGVVKAVRAARAGPAAWTGTIAFGAWEIVPQDAPG